MNIDQIERFLSNIPAYEIQYVKISFRKRDEMYGLFIRDKDYEDLKSKNFWRVVTRFHFDEYKRTGDLSLARIFNGWEFSRLLSYDQTF
jgi:hypothetical protein